MGNSDGEQLYFIQAFLHAFMQVFLPTYLCFNPTLAPAGAPGTGPDRFRSRSLLHPGTFYRPNPAAEGEHHKVWVNSSLELVWKDQRPVGASSGTALPPPFFNVLLWSVGLFSWGWEVTAQLPPVSPDLLTILYTDWLKAHSSLLLGLGLESFPKGPAAVVPP